MAMLPGMGPEKQKTATFFDPKKEKDSQRQRKMAELLVMQGNQPVKNEVAGGMVVKRSPWENINQAAQKYMGEYKLEKSDRADAETETRRQEMIGQALEAWGTDPQAAAAMLGQDPRTSEMAMRLMQGEVDYSRQKERWGQQDALQRELASARAAASGGSTPAPMQIANQMFELEQAMNNHNLDPKQRFLAERQYNLLGQAAKTYGFDRGIQAGPMDGYSGVLGQQNFPPVPMDANGVMQMPQANGQEPNLPLNPMQYQEMMQQGKIGMSTIPGYGDAAAQIAAQKKRAESIAAEEGKRIGEAGGSLTFLEANMPKLESVVNNLGDLSDQATYTTAGRGIDFARKELGLEPTRGAVARAEYVATVDNEILPLLRDTFGAAFTVKEGETLRNTLGDPNKSPAEKKAVLNAFINQKKAQVNSLQRQVGVSTTAPINQQFQPQIAVNPQTGQRMINRGNGWEPYNGN